MGALTRPHVHTAEIIAVGSELLGSTRMDTNSLFVAGTLASLGIVLKSKTVVGDDRALLSALFAQAMTRVDLVVLTGGLGPTDDDVTRDAVAGVLGLTMHEDPSISEKIRTRFAKRGMRMPENNLRQAMIPAGAVAMDNPNGTAPGLYIEHGDKVVVLLPGPPRELQPMFSALCEGRLGARAGEERLHTTSLFMTGRSESHIDEIAQPIYSRFRDVEPPVETTILAGPGQIELHLTARARNADAAQRVLDEARRELIAALGDIVFSTDGRYLEKVVGDLLRERGLTIAVAESCTGGLLTSRLTDVPGSSAYVVAGVAAYANEAKTILADVPAELIAQFGAVSEPVATALAEGIRRRTGATIGVGITGIAGPDGGSPEKPVGTVAIAVATGGGAQVRTFSFPGGRPQVKFQATQAALDMVRRTIHATVPGG